MNLDSSLFLVQYLTLFICSYLLTKQSSHKAWVSDVQWSPTDPYVLASNSHDGTLKLWDIRSSIPLHTILAVGKKGEKALCLSFGDECIYSGGSDCVVNKFACKL